ncbi:MAG: dTMP kinase [Candidatus Firestonebacteria bacterium]|nr:dTMP kinase [Candidatus Firestonebacteria bacterium]
MALLKRGLFITLEGPDGSGKSTQIKALAKQLQKSGYRVLLTREPGGGPKYSLAEKIRSLLLTPGKSVPNPQTELLLFLAARAQHVQDFIRPALQQGKVVLCERFSDATLAYQVGGRKLPSAFVLAADAFARQGVKPDLTLFLELEPKTGLRRAFKAKAGHDRLETESLGFHRNVFRMYRLLARREPRRIRVISAEGASAQVSEQIWNCVSTWLARKGRTHAAA